MPLSDIIKAGKTCDYIGWKVKEELCCEMKKGYEKAWKNSSKKHTERKDHYESHNFKIFK